MLRRSGRAAAFIAGLALLATVLQPSAARADSEPSSSQTALKMGLIPADDAQWDSKAKTFQTQETLPGDTGDSPQDARRRALELAPRPPGDPTAPKQPGKLVPLAGRTPPGAPMQEFVDECLAKEEAGSGIFGHVRNRLEWCARYTTYAISFDTRGRSSGVVMPVIAIGYGRDDGLRSVKFFMKPYGPPIFWGDITLASRLTFDLECTPSKPVPGCSTAGGEKTKSLAEWAADYGSSTWVDWQLNSDEQYSSANDKILFHWFNFKMGFQGSYQRAWADYVVRCDSASYFPGRTKACVFHDVVPHVQYYLYNADGSKSDVHAVAEHIKDAFDHPNASYPLKIGGDKVFPGQYPGEPNDGRQLQRVPYESRDEVVNRQESRKACQREGDYIDTGLPSPPVTPGQECDEYPFASTVQGAAHPYWDFSVRAVSKDDNGKAGTVLQGFYREDRILYYDDDFFYVEILDGRAPGTPGGPPIVDQPPKVNAGPDMEGSEGQRLPLLGSAVDDHGLRSVRWTYSFGPDGDPGATCTFDDDGTPQTGITCTDDGTVTVTLEADDGVNPPQRDSAILRLRNVEPQLPRGPQPNLRPAVDAKTVNVLEPVPWSVFRAGTSVALKAPYEDPGSNDTQVCDVDWDDKTTEHYDGQDMACDRQHVYQHPGMYTIKLKVTDDDGGSDTISTMVVVYDPQAGFTTAGGFIDSPAGALTGAPDTVGRLHIQLNPKYLPHDEGPAPSNGKFNVKLDGAGFELDSTKLEWLVVTLDGKVAVKGLATVNGQDGYGFVGYGYNDPDKFRLVVWPLTAGKNPGTELTYDNRSGKDYDLDLTDPQELAGGSINIHH